MHTTRLFGIPGLAAALALTLLIATPGASASPGSGSGNSGNAKLCQKGGWQSEYRSDGTRFASVGDCVSYAAHGGTLTSSPPFVNHAPQGADGTVTTSENSTYTFAAGDFGFSDPNDSPPNNLLAVEITTLPTVGTLTDGGTPVVAGEFISVTDINAGLLVYTPATNTTGSPFDSFTFQVQDDGGTANGGTDTDPTPRTLTINVT
jgi:hypothetical protein